MRKELLLFGLSLGLVGCGSDQPATVVQSAPVVNQELDLVTVSGKSEVKVVPDKASISVGVEFMESTAEEANKELGERVSAITVELQRNGIAEKDIATDYYSVDPEYRWIDDTRQLQGYSGSANLTVSGIDMDKVNSIIDIVMGAGADSVGGIQYYSSGYTNSYSEALDIAIKEAREKADHMGESAGFKVVRVHEMSEGYQDTSARYVTNSMKTTGYMDAESATGAAVTPGEISVEARVNVTYVIE